MSDKFKVGDEVVCIRGEKINEPQAVGTETEGRGMGWRIGLKYKITSISGFGHNVYFGGCNTYGVWEDHLRLYKENIWKGKPR